MKEKKYIVTLSGLKESHEVPVYAESIEQAELLTHEYEDAGFVVERIRQEVKHNET
ncbi:MAG: hypothetical protein [Caudoviricetes sp.]|nr:MAG: hypothetical protein [Caudoviricetes sp.]